MPSYQTGLANWADNYYGMANPYPTSSFSVGGLSGAPTSTQAFTNALNLDSSSLYDQLAGSNGFGLGDITGLVGAGAGVLQGLGGLANAYMGYKNYGLAKKQFGFQKGLANRNLANQAKTINNAYSNAAQVAAGMIGGTDASGNFGFTDPSIVKKYQEEAKKQYVDSSPIK